MMKHKLQVIFAIALFATLTIQSPAISFDGPKKGKGLKVKVLSEVDLSTEIKGLEGRKLRYRYWWIAPGGIVPIHSHADRPALIYVVKGEIYEHRSDQEEPHIYKAGEVSNESQGVKHWWENKGNETVELIATDICNAETGSC